MALQLQRAEGPQEILLEILIPDPLLHLLEILILERWVPADSDAGDLLL
jgi:hypothetical protein